MKTYRIFNNKKESRMTRKYLMLCMACIFIISGCASPYKPSNNVLNIKSSMKKNEAKKMVATTLVNSRKNEGICQANGYPDAGWTNAGWYLNEKTPSLKYHAQGFSFNASKRTLSITTHGNVATGTYTNTKRSYTPFRRNIKYSDFDDATIFYKENSMNRVCSFGEGYAEVRISLKTGVGHWVSVLVRNKELEKFIAATMVVAPQILFKTK